MLSQRIALIRILSQIKVNRLPGGDYEEQRLFQELLESGMLEAWQEASGANHDRGYSLTLRGEIFLQSLLGDFS